MRLRLLFVTAATLGIASVAIQCRNATEMIIDVTTDVPCLKVGGTSITLGVLGKLDGKTPTVFAPANTCTGSGTNTIGSLVVTPSGDNDEPLAFLVTTGIGVDPSTCSTNSATCILARRELRFIPHEKIRIEVPMRQVCAGVVCDPSSTCFDGSCVLATIDPSKCRGEICDEGSLGPATDGGAPIDSGTPVPVTDGSAGPSDAGAPDGNVILPLPDAGPGTLDSIDLAIGDQYTCMLVRAKARVYCWGTNAHGQLGSPTAPTSANTPQLVPSFTDVVAIAGGAEAVAARKSDGTFWMWGNSNTHTIIGSPNQDVTTPLEINAGTGFDPFCVGKGHTCGFGSDGTLTCWGELMGFPDDHSTPVTNVFDAGALKKIRCGDDVTEMLMVDGTMLTFGQSSQSLGRAANATATGSSLPDSGTTPLPVHNLPPIADFSSGEQDVFTFQNDGGVWAWGTNDGNQITIGTDSFKTPAAPLRVSDPFLDFSHVVGGNQFFCGIKKTDGAVYCWGTNEYGVLGQELGGEQRHPNPPVKVPIPDTSAAINLWGFSATACAHLANGRLFCWGRNDAGQLGGGTNENDGGAHPTPLEVTLPN